MQEFLQASEHIISALEEYAHGLTACIPTCRGDAIDFVKNELELPWPWLAMDLIKCFWAAVWGVALYGRKMYLVRTVVLPEPLAPLFSIWSSVCKELGGRDVLSVLIRGALRGLLLGTTWMFLISRQVHRGGQLTQHVGELLVREYTEEPPMRRRNRNHHAVVGAANLQGQRIA